MNVFDSIEIPKEKQETLRKITKELDILNGAVVDAQRRKFRTNQQLWDSLNELFPETKDWNCSLNIEGGTMKIHFWGRKEKP